MCVHRDQAEDRLNAVLPSDWKSRDDCIRDRENTHNNEDPESL